jgi:foldase protein PrsA
MKRTLTRIVLFLLAGAAGWGTSELLHRADFGRALLARFIRSEVAIRAQTNLRSASAGEAVPEAQIAREIDLLRSQFADGARFEQVLKASAVSVDKLRDEVAEDLRERAWIEKQIGPQIAVSEGEIREYYAANRALFAQPQRYRASHLFVAAPDGSPSDVMTVKLRAIEAISMRMIAGEKFSALIAEASEDEASKRRGGDLGYFSETRVPPEFIHELKKLRVGETSGPIRSKLGYHLVQLTEAKEPRELSLDDVRAEITAALANRKRALAVAALTERLGTPEFATQ